MIAEGKYSKEERKRKEGERQEEGGDNPMIAEGKYSNGKGERQEGRKAKAQRASKGLGYCVKDEPTFHNADTRQTSAKHDPRPLKAQKVGSPAAPHRRASFKEANFNNTGGDHQ